ncbi:restriction endonuclease subunit S, partial [Turicimonas muris]
VECREKWPMVEIRNFIKESNSRNTESLLTKEDIVGVSTEKNFISTKADTTTVSTEGYKIVEARFFVFVPDTSRRGDKMSLAFNSLNRRVLVTSIATVFEVFDLELLLPEYLFLQFKRPEFDRYARFNSWGSARETFTWEDMCRVKIPLPPIEVQRAIVALYTCAEEARKIAAEARELLKKACPAMVQSAAHYKVGAFR